jgi:LysM repeat protein
MASRHEEQTNQQIALFEEVRIALFDVKQTLNTQKLDLELLEEKVAKLDRRSEVSPALEQRLSTLEHLQEGAMSDIRSLNQFLKETASSLDQLQQQFLTLDQRLKHESERLGEVANLRSTISSLSKAMSSHTQNMGKTHRVRTGESLEKIARQYETSVEEIKRTNGLTTNKILIGQELKIPQG